MAVAQGYGKTVTSGSVFAYDVADTRNSYIGRPTVNVSAGLGLTNYNNVPGNVNTSITATGGTYKGAAIYQQTITPLDATGVSYLTNGNNPGIGVYHGGGGGTGGQYSGHTIFFKPVGPMYSSPIFTHYSNIAGWQSTSNYEDMGDGWFRANVLWYNASTLSDQKFWAINPSGATANVPITIYWAGPFKENLNSTTISQFVEGTRSATQGLLPLVGTSTLNLSNVSFDSNAQIVFDGTDDTLSLGNFSVPYLTVSTWVYKTASTTNQGICRKESGWAVSQYNGNLQVAPGTSWNFYDTGYVIPLNTWVNIVYTYSGTGGSDSQSVYINGNRIFTNSNGSGPITSNSNSVNVGYDDNNWFWNGYIANTIIYNRALSSSEVQQNYNKYKSRFNLS